MSTSAVYISTIITNSAHPACTSVRVLLIPFAGSSRNIHVVEVVQAAEQRRRRSTCLPNRYGPEQLDCWPWARREGGRGYDRRTCAYEGDLEGKG